MVTGVTVVYVLGRVGVSGVTGHGSTGVILDPVLPPGVEISLSIFQHGLHPVPSLRRGFYIMPVFGGRCRFCEQPVYYWVSLGGHEIESSSLVFYSEQSNPRREAEIVRNISDITGLQVYGLPDRARFRRHATYPGLHRIPEQREVQPCEVIDLTEDSPGEETGHTRAGTAVLHEGRVPN